ncbi:hypothetical protein D3C72_2225170 [compost metagenome]
MRAQGIAADAVDFHAGGDELEIGIAESDVFRGAARGVVLRIEKQHGGLGWAAQQLKGFAAGHGGAKVGYANEGLAISHRFSPER